MKREGYRPSTIEATVKGLKALSKTCDLDDPESVKDAIAFRDVSEGRKVVLVDFYKRYAYWRGIEFHSPRYKRVEKLPFIPLESEIDQLMGALGRKCTCFIALLKDTGVRSGEALNLRWIDLNPNGVLRVEPEKGSKPRQFKLKSQTIALLNNLPKRSEYVFGGGSFKHFQNTFYKSRKNIAIKLNNPRINRINFKSLRHFKATIEYHRTKDILHVMQLLGHKNIRNTLVYTHLVEWSDEEYVCKVATTVDEAKTLIESGFEYVTDIDGKRLFRKRK